MKPKPRLPKPGWVVVGPDGLVFWTTARLTRKRAMGMAEVIHSSNWSKLRRLGYRVRRCQVMV